MQVPARTARWTRGPRAAAWYTLAALLLLAACALARPAFAQLAYDAVYVSQVVPGFIETNTQATVTVTMQNTGTATWMPGDVFLSTQEPQDNYYWCIQGNQYGSQSGNRVQLPNAVAPNAQVTFTFVVLPEGCKFSAPSPLRFRMLSQAHGTFGQETPDPEVVVSGASVYVSQQVPAVVPAGATVLVTETFQNTTTSTWQTTDGYTLAAAGPAGNTTWSVSPVPLPVATDANGNVTFTFYAVVPATVGTYNFQWQMSQPDGTPFGATSPATAVQVIAAGPPNYEGLWWATNGVESGWGINFAHQADTIFATWFTYDLTGKGVWLAMTAPLTATPGVYAGTLYQMTGPPFNATPFNPAQVVGVPVGSATLTFTDLNDGTFAYTYNGITQTKSIAREVYSQLPTCTFGILTDLTQAYNYQDLWWAAPASIESGWGINLTHQGDTIFATWFTYDLDGTPMWLVGSAPKVTLGNYAGTLYRTTGPAFNAVPFDPTAVAGTDVGTFSLAFTDGNTGTFGYTVNGITQTKPITREVFATPGTVCQ